MRGKKAHTNSCLQNWNKWSFLQKGLPRSNWLSFKGWVVWKLQSLLFFAESGRMLNEYMMGLLSLAERQTYNPCVTCPVLYKWAMHAACSVASVLWDPKDCSLPGSSVHGILQARILEWVSMPSSRGSSRLRDRTRLSCVYWIGRCIVYCWDTG